MRESVGRFTFHYRRSTLKPITYSLPSSSDTAAAYFTDVASLADELLSRGSHSLLFLRRYMTHLHLTFTEDIRTEGEYLFDLLTLGTLWAVYAKRAVSTHAIPLTILDALYRMRRAARPAKKIIDRLRGKLMALWLPDAPDDRSHVEAATLRNIRKLLLWLRATGEFREEEKRLRLIVHYLETLTPFDAQDAVESVLRLADWFELRSRELLSAYTENVGTFLREVHPGYKGREDMIFCGRAEAEYHLSMLGAEIMNRSFRDSFHRTGKKAVLLPACMRIRKEHCEAVQESLDMRCTHCSANCAVNRIEQLGLQHGFSVHIIPHSSDFSRWLSTWAVGRDIGVVGVACPLNLIAGGLELKALDIPAQCILLNYSGCRSHWHETGIPTSLDEEELLRLIAAVPCGKHDTRGTVDQAGSPPLFAAGSEMETTVPDPFGESMLMVPPISPTRSSIPWMPKPAEDAPPGFPRLRPLPLSSTTISTR